MEGDGSRGAGAGQDDSVPHRPPAPVSRPTEGDLDARRFRSSWELRLAGCTTTRQRATQAKSILGKLRKHFNVSVADLGGDAPADLAALGFAAVARTRREGHEKCSTD